MDTGEPRHVFEVEVAALPAAVWRALTDPELTARYYFGCRFESTLDVGAPFRYGDDAVVGTVVAADRPRRLELRARYAFDPRTSAEPPHRELWEVEPRDGGRSRVRLTMDGYAGETVSFQMAASGGQQIVDGLRLVLEPDALPRRVERVGEVVVRALDPARRDAFLAFFDRDAFRDNPAGAACYCTEPHRIEDDFRSPAQNRAAAAELIASCRLRGYLAYADGQVVGWCNAAPRSALPRLAREPVEDAERVGAIACFVVAVHYRRHGVARALLDAALAGFAAQGLAVAEAYPARDPSSDGAAFRGPLALYERAGFAVHRDLGPTLVVRKRLAGRVSI